MADTLASLLAADAQDAWQYYDPLAAIYQAALRKMARDAVKPLHRAQWTLIAAAPPADWAIPDPDELLDVAKAAGELEGKTRRLREQIAETSVGGTLAAYGLSFNLRNPVIQNAITQMGQHITRIVEDQRSDIMKSLQESWEQGLPIRDASRKMVQDSIITSTDRAQMIARTELTSATNGGSLAAARLVNDASPPDTRMLKSWTATNDSRTRDSHAQADVDYSDAPIPLDQPFIVGGFPLQHPGDPSGPPEEVINCRCVVTYVQPGGEQPVAPPPGGMAPVGVTPASTVRPSIGTRVVARSLIGDAKAVEPEVTRDLKAVVRSRGGHMGGLKFRLKTEESLTGKLARKAAEKSITPEAYAQSVGDVLRYTGVFNPEDYARGVEQTISDLRAKGYDIRDGEIENYWTPGDDYQGINMNLRTRTGYRFELQFHTPQSIELKNGELHKLYEQFRDEKNAHERLRLWNRMVRLSDSLPLPDESVLRIGTVTTHAPPMLADKAEALAHSLVEAAGRHEPVVTGDLSRFVTANGGTMEGLDFRLKSANSLIRKLSTKALDKGITMQQYSTQVTDVLRYTGVFESDGYARGVTETINSLRDAGYKIDESDISNFWEYGDDYNGINIDVTAPDGYRFELQFHTPESFDLKNGELHRLYERFRVSRDPFERKALFDQMVSMSDKLLDDAGHYFRSDVNQIGTLTRHEHPVAHGTAEALEAAGREPIPEESTAWADIRAYTGSVYDDINAYLRYGTVGKDGPKITDLEAGTAGTVGDLAAYTPDIELLAERVRNIESAMLPAKKPIMLYRGYKKAVLGDDLESLIGKTIEDPGFASTSADRDTAENFAQYGASGSNRLPDDQVVMELAVPKGYPVLNVARAVTGTGEYEVVLPPGTKYIVQSVRRDPEGRWVIRAIIQPR